MPEGFDTFKGFTPRLLSLLVPSTKVIAGTPLTMSGAGEGWQIVDVDDSSSTAAVWRGSIDLAGYSMKDLTFFISETNIQENQNFIGPTTKTYCLDVISTCPISDADLNWPLSTFTAIPSFGFLDSPKMMEEIIYARAREFYSDVGWSNSNLLGVANSNVWGQGNATAASRIYCTRIVMDVTAVSVITPQANFQILGSPEEEAELPYMMRLKRSYELAQ